MIEGLKGNWADLIIILILIYFASEAFRHGLWIILAEFFSFLGSLIISLRIYKFVSSLLTKNFDMSGSLANAVGFLLAAVILELVLGYFFAYAISRLPTKIRKMKYSRFLAIFPALGEGLILISFIITLLMSMPINPQLKKDLSSSRIGGILIQKTANIERNVNEVFGGVLNDSLTYLTVKPGSSETLNLKVTEKNLTVDEKTELEMFALVNKERRANNVKELVWAPQLVTPARDHAKDMWERSYFGHYSPEGEDVGDRLEKYRIRFFLAGENLALAPTLSLAHDGLMNSPGHRENILEPKFRKMGIGVIENGYYGKMFVQVFTD